MVEQYRYFTNLGVTRRQCFPIGIRESQLSYDLNQEDRKLAFDESFTTDFIFNNDNGDYDYLLAIEQSGNKCRSIRMEIEKPDCSGNYSLWKEARLRLVDGQWNLDSCIVSIRPTVLNDYTCFNDNADNEVNLLDLPVNKITAHYLRGTIEYFEYDSAGYNPDDAAQFGGVNPATIGWKMYKRIRQTAVLPPTETYKYAREVLTLPAAQNPGTDWIYLQDVGTDKKWARLPLLIYDWQNTNTNSNSGDQFSLNCLPFGGTEPGEWDNGMFLKDLLTYFADNYCALQVVSNFLQINPDSTFAATYPTFTDGITYNHIVFQKSDAKRPNDENNATKAPFTFKKLLVGVCTMHNLWWKIDNGKLRIEHVSYWQRAISYDLTTGDAKKRVVRTRQYKYQVDKLPRFESFTFMESGTADFTGVPIEYVGDCVTDKEDERTLQNIVDQITTDIEYCLLHADGNDSKVSDEGMAIMATQYNADEDKYYVFSLSPILEADRHINNTLGWAFLHKEYHRHERLQLNGYLNNQYQNFLSTKPNKQRTRVGIKFCCDDAIDLNGFVVTDLGNALISQAAFIQYQDELEMDLVYMDAIGNNACLRPRKFIFHHFDNTSQAFFFDTQFELPGNYQAEIEAINPNGEKQTFYINPDTDGIFPATFNPYIEGVWKFRKRVVCDVDFAGPWTDYVTLNTATMQTGSTPLPCSATIMGSPSYTDKYPPRRFRFKYDFEVRESIQCKVTTPGGQVYFASIEYYVRNRNMLDFYVVLNSDIVAGLYRFRFRKLCDYQNGVYNGWSNYVDVNV